MENKKLLLLLLSLSVGISWARPGFGAPGPAEIVKKSLDQMVFRTQGAEMRISMTLRNKQGETRVRTLFARSLREGGLSRTLVRFLSPSDVAGTAFLFLENKDRDDDQHMFLPALKVVRRIAGKQKNTSFMGSDFTYADLEWRDMSEADYKELPEEKVGQYLCHVIDSVPRNKGGSYSRVRAWIRKQDSVLMRLHFFDGSGAQVKTLFVKEVKRVDGVVMVNKVKMTSLKTGHTTFLDIDEIKLRSDLTQAQFTLRALQSGGG